MQLTENDARLLAQCANTLKLLCERYNLSPALPVPPAPGTIEEVKAQLTSLVKDKGLPAAKALLSKFGVTKVSELKPEHYAQFIQEAEKCNPLPF